MTRQTSTYTCTRPQLAGELMQKGYSATQTVNPWNPNLKAWTFKIDAAAAQIIKAYYDQIGKKTPEAVARMLDTSAEGVSE